MGAVGVILTSTLSDLWPPSDEDVLDTWFSSGLFPFSILGWPNQVIPGASTGWGGSRGVGGLAPRHSRPALPPVGRSECVLPGDAAGDGP